MARYSVLIRCIWMRSAVSVMIQSNLKHLKETATKTAAHTLPSEHRDLIEYTLFGATDGAPTIQIMLQRIQSGYWVDLKSFNDLKEIGTINAISAWKASFSTLYNAVEHHQVAKFIDRYWESNPHLYSTCLPSMQYAYLQRALFVNTFPSQPRHCSGRRLSRMIDSL